MPEAEIPTILIRFNNEMRLHEIPLFRGAVIHSLQEASVFFHNHSGKDTLRYAYPLIQYKCIDGKAAMLGIKEGVSDVEKFLACNPDIMRIGQRRDRMLIHKINRGDTALKLTSEWNLYELHNYLPLSQENYMQYRNAESLAERCTLLEQCLVGNILSFAKGVGVHFDEQIKVVLQNAENIKLYEFKKVKMMAFDIVFNANVSLPQYIGLGRKVSFGFGTLTWCDDKCK